MSNTNNNSEIFLTNIKDNLNKVVKMGYSKTQVFEDWVALMFHAFNGQDDPNYFKVLGKYKNEGKMGEREADYFAAALGGLMGYMQVTNKEILSELYMEFCKDNNEGRVFTPVSVAMLMAQLTQDDKKEDPVVADLTCGAGTLLIASAKVQTFEQNNKSFFIGCDLNLTCAYMTALNLMFFNLNGIIIHGNSLTGEVFDAWGTERHVPLGGKIIKMNKEDAEKFLKKEEVA